MARLTEQDLNEIKGMRNAGNTILAARVKGGKYSDSDNYGIALGVSDSGNYVTWEFHKLNGEPSFYWGHYFMKDEEAAVADFRLRQ